MVDFADSAFDNGVPTLDELRKARSLSLEELHRRTEEAAAALGDPFTVHLEQLQRAQIVEIVYEMELRRRVDKDVD